MSEPREAFRLAYEALLHANHMLYTLPLPSHPPRLAVHHHVDAALKFLSEEAEKWGVNVDWMHNPPLERPTVTLDQGPAEDGES